MTKSDFIKAIAERSELTQKDIKIMLDAMSDVLLFDVIAKEDSVKLGNVCTISGVTRPARTARNPMTGEAIEVPEKRGYPKCKFTKAAKE